MARFGKGNRGGFGKRNSGRDDGDREERGSSNRGGRGGYNSRRGGGRNSNSDALKLGDISVSEKVIDKEGDGIIDDLRGANASMYVKIFPPKGVDEVVLRRGDFMNIRLCKSKYGGDRTVGFVTVSQSDD